MSKRPYAPLWHTRDELPTGLVLFCAMSRDVQLRDAYFVDWLVDGALTLYPGRPWTHWMRLPAPPVIVP